MKAEMFTQEEIIEIARRSTSHRNFTINLGYSQNSGSYLAISQKLIERYDIDVSHFTGSAWNKELVNRKETFKYGVKVKSEKLKRALTKIRGIKCENCRLSEWLGIPIPLENHHIDGNPLNNIETNLQLLCPNCHSLTSNYRNNKRAAE